MNLNWLKNYYWLNREILKILSLGCVIFIIFETLAPRSVTAVINLTAWFALWLISAIIELLTSNE